MQAAGYMYGDLVKRKLKISASFANVGVPVIGGAGAVAGCIPATTTNFTEGLGLALDIATYTTTQSATMVEGIVSVDTNPGLLMRSLLSGGATEGTALAILTNTAASAGGTTITATNVMASDQKGGMAWCISGANVGYSRVITTHTASTSFVVVVPFPNAIAVGDQFLMCPHANIGDGAASSDGNKGVTLTTLLTQVDATAASGAVAGPVVSDLELNGASDSYVLFTNADHVFGDNTL